MARSVILEGEGGSIEGVCTTLVRVIRRCIPAPPYPARWPTSWAYSGPALPPRHSRPSWGCLLVCGSGVAEAVRCGGGSRWVGGEIVDCAAKACEQVVGEVVAEAFADHHPHDRLVGRRFGHGVGGSLPTLGP